jgi:hypothetical protein
MGVEMLIPVSLLLSIMVVVRVTQYLYKYKSLAKKISLFDPDLYLKRYCDRIFKTPYHSRALFDDIVNPEDAPESIRLNFSADFTSIRESFYSTLKWFIPLIVLVAGVNYLHL